MKVDRGRNSRFLFDHVHDRWVNIAQPVVHLNVPHGTLQREIVTVWARLEDGAGVGVVIWVRRVINRHVELRICPDRDFALQRMALFQIHPKNNRAVDNYTCKVVALWGTSKLANPGRSESVEDERAGCQDEGNRAPDAGEMLGGFRDDGFEDFEGVVGWGHGVLERG